MLRLELVRPGPNPVNVWLLNSKPNRAVASDCCSSSFDWQRDGPVNDHPLVAIFPGRYSTFGVWALDERLPHVGSKEHLEWKRMPTQLRQFGIRSILFICTGNTCRSPLAESLCNTKLALSLGCSVENLRERGFIVQSAGLAALPGQPAADEALQVARELDADLSQHCSQLLNEALLRQATHVFVMTQNHQLLLLDYFPDKGPTPRILSPTGADLDDPIGCDLAVYRSCAQAILQALDLLLPELQKETM